MKLVVFGLTVSSSWGNGHATLWRGLWRALVQQGHTVTFFERDVPYYAEHRDVTDLPGGRLVLYADWDGVRATAAAELADADVGMVTSYCPDGRAACDLVLSSGVDRRAFYDLDTGVTLARVAAGEDVPFLPAGGTLAGFDVVFSYTGGQALAQLKAQLHARRVAPLYGHVDPAAHFPVPAVDRYRADVSYIGTYAADRQPAVQQLLIDPATRLPDRRFSIAGSLYPADFPWRRNIWFFKHLPPVEHPAFYCSSRWTLNTTRVAMAALGYCPSGRFFESAACGTPVLSDWWDGLDTFYTPGREVVVVRNADDVVAAVEMTDAEVTAIGRAARERTLDEHTSDDRATTLVTELERA